MPSELSVMKQRWLQLLLEQMSKKWGIDASRPLEELAMRSALSGLHLGAGKLLKLAKLRHEVRHRGEMRWALWRVTLPQSRQKPTRGRLLWIPGWGDTPLGWFSVALAAATRQGFSELVFMDFPGFHGSLAHSRCITQMDRLLEITGDCVQELKPEILVGHSLGGWLATHAAVHSNRSSSPLEKLVLMAPSGICGSAESRELWRAEFREFVSATDHQVYGSRLFAKPPRGWNRFGSVFLSFLARPDTQEFLESVDERHFLDSRLLGDSEKLSHLEIQLLWGAKDGVVPARFAPEWSRAVPHSQVTLWEDVGHMPHFEAPWRLLRWLRGALSDRT